MKVVIAVLGCRSELFTLLIEEGIKKTWGNYSNPNIRIVYYYGQQLNEPYIMSNNDVILNVDDGLGNVALKTLLFYEFLNKQNFDYVFRTNCSSYVNIDNLLKFLENKPKENFFSAIIGTHEGKQFASGSGYFLSKDLVQKVVDNKHLINTSLIDDLALSFALTSLGINILPGRRQDFSSVEQVKREIDITNYHYRCKSRHRDLNDTYTDIEIMKTIHKHLYE
jgi:hypothetical protein